MFGLKDDWDLEPPPRYYTLEDYEGGTARWCPGCGDLAVLTAVQRICRDEQLLPEKTVCVSGIGCSSRFPHYMKTYGFHGLHGRAFPVACGIKSRRPDLDIWVATGDGDCCSIGAGHWVHATRYNMNMVAMLFDNHVYGLTKKQSSPTSPLGFSSNTHPEGTWLPPLDPLSATLGFTNASFVAQTVDWNPVHLYQILHRAWQHRGFSFVRILQRCPTYTHQMFDDLQSDPSLTTLLVEPGKEPDPTLARTYKNQETHDSSDLTKARVLATRDDTVPIGILYQNPEAPCYDDHMNVGLDMKVEDRLAALEREMDRFTI